MHPHIRRWIFVTGTPRSATTFVGKMLSSDVRVDYIHEPFNPHCGIAGVDTRYLYLEENDPRETALRPEIERLLDYKAHLKTGYYPNDRPLRRLAKRFVGSRGPFYLRLARLNPFHDSAVIKDPIGCLLTEYLLLRYRMKPIVVVRHPVGFVASTLRLNWDLSLEPVVNQRRLVDRFFDDDDREVARRYRSGTPLQRAAVLWRFLNRALLGMAREHAGILVVTHEEISRDPLPHFERIFAHAGLPFSEAARRRIVRHTSGGSGEARAGHVQDFRRDSSRIHEQRRSMLAAGEIAQVLDITAPVALLKYSPEALRS
jgi:hypothetical protein